MYIVFTLPGFEPIALTKSGVGATYATMGAYGRPWRGAAGVIHLCRGMSRRLPWVLFALETLVITESFLR